ncbi:hypothetical protein MOQ72_04895 [Saccharopolyspora sp. K220]|uniref:hypothetical protein n=1 Tax=Saccharopolyspora soli TaxID=2926618 RepID=UPI001F5A68C3|nr:hypothetical protein [Saccharopolyspora soli]MCI2416752.1 hypothetical protein [Saccharopolyspora soli]
MKSDLPPSDAADTDGAGLSLTPTLPRSSEVVATASQQQAKRPAGRHAPSSTKALFRYLRRDRPSR